MSEVSIRHYYENLYPSCVAFYMECEVTEVNKIGKNHFLIHVEIPLPVGGVWYDLVSEYTKVELDVAELLKDKKGEKEQ